MLVRFIPKVVMSDMSVCVYTNSVCILCVYTAKIVGAGDQENYNQCICLYCVCVCVCVCYV